MPSIDRYLPASFRGVQFLAEVETSLGRRVVRHEVPRTKALAGTARTILEDIGIQARVFSVRARILDQDADLIANELHNALEQEGPGDFVHPWLGRRSVMVVGTGSRSDSTNELHHHAFTFELEEVAEEELSIVEESAEVDAAADALDAAAGADLEEQMATKGFPEYVREASAAATRAAGVLMRGLRFVQATAGTVTAYTRQVTDLINLASALATAPADLVVRVQEALALVGDSGMAFRDSFWVYRTLFGAPAATKGGTSAAALAADKNALLITDLMRLAALTGAARSAAEAEWESTADAEAARRALNDELDALEARASDTVYGTLQDLRVQLDRALPGTARRGEDRRTVTLQASLPATVLAYRYHGDASRGDEIVAANRIAHPLFVPGSVPVTLAIDG